MKTRTESIYSASKPSKNARMKEMKENYLSILTSKHKQDIGSDVLCIQRWWEWDGGEEKSPGIQNSNISEVNK